MELIYANNAFSTLAGPITNVALSLTVQAGAGALFPNPGQNQYFVVEMVPVSTGLPGEIMWCTARSGDTMTIIRGQEGTTPTAYGAGDTVVNVVSSGGIDSFAQIPTYAGNPNGALPGQAGSATASPSMIFDTVDLILWICSASGSSSTAVWIASFGRTKITANTQFYVNASTGNDVTGTGTSGAPWATLQHAWNVILDQYDLNGFVVTINATGAFTAGVVSNGMPPGASGPASVIWNFASGASISATNASCLVAQTSTLWTIQGGATPLVLTATGTSNEPLTGCGVASNQGSQVIVNGNVNFGACAVAQLVCGPQSLLTINPGNYTLTGGGQNMYLGLGGNGSIQSAAFTVTGTPAYSNSAVNLSQLSYLGQSGSSFSGSATGKVYSVIENSVFLANGLTFPGNAGGTTASGGQAL